MSKKNKTLVFLANETDGTGYTYEISKTLFEIISSMSEHELSYIMPECSIGINETQAKEYAMVLEEIGRAYGLSDKECKVKLKKIPTIWFESGWASKSSDFQKHVCFPKTFNISNIMFSVKDTEYDVLQKINELLPLHFQVWGFGFSKDYHSMMISVAYTTSSNINEETDFFASYTSIGKGIFRLVATGHGFVNIKENYLWNEDLQYTLPGILLSQR